MTSHPSIVKKKVKACFLTFPWKTCRNYIIKQVVLLFYCIKMKNYLIFQKLTTQKRHMLRSWNKALVVWLFVLQFFKWIKVWLELSFKWSSGIHPWLEKKTASCLQARRGIHRSPVTVKPGKIISQFMESQFSRYHSWDARVGVVWIQLT